MAAARFHGVAGCLYQSLRHLAPEGAAVAAALEPAYLGSLHNHLAVVGELPAVADAFDTLGIGWMVLKGPVLAEAIYCRPDLRSYGDLDLLVHPEDFGAALDALEKFGYRVQDRNWELSRREMLGEVQLLSPRGTAVDLHWHPLNEGALRHTFRVDAAALLRRSRTVRLGTTTVRTPSKADTLVYLSLHSARSGGNRLLWLKDLEEAVLHDRPPWGEVIEAASRWRAGLVCALMLRRTGRALGVPIPAEVLDALEGGSAWVQLASLVEQVLPVERSLGSRSPARALARSTRTDDRSSAAALMLAGGHAARLRGVNLRPPLPDSDPASPQSIYHETGGGDGRARFVAAVARAGSEQQRKPLPD